MANPKISVIIPIYGTEKYLDKCLRSVRQQTFKDIEIICVDDCSPDNSYKIVEKHSKQDKRVKLIRHEKNLGLGGARNTAIRAAKADYIASVDSDDYMSSKMLDTLWQATDCGWFDIVCCGYSRVDESGNVLSKEPYEDKQISNDKNSINIFSTLNPAFWNKLWRKSLFVENDIYFPEHDYYEDMSTTPRILAKSRYIKGIKDNLYCYVARDQSIMNSVSDKHLIDYLKGFEILFKFLKEEGLAKHYAEEFNHFIQGTTIYYAKYILNSTTLSLDKKTQYLRFIILFRITFIENFGKFDFLDIGGLIARLEDEDLHGVYFDKFQSASKNLIKKEEVIKKQWAEIDTRAEINIKLEGSIKSREKVLAEAKESIKSTWLIVDDKEKLLKEKKEEIKQLLEYKKSSQNELKLAKRDLKSSKTEAAEKISLLETEAAEKLTLLKADFTEKIYLLEMEATANVSMLHEKISLLKANSEKRISLLEAEAAEKVSLSQMIAVFLFAFLTFFVMSRNQRFKLINKPILFFRDSKSSFAKRYASWFNIV